MKRMIITVRYFDPNSNDQQLPEINYLSMYES